MCGVIGMHSTEPRGHHLDAFCRLMEQSKIRGLHSFGISSSRPGHGDGIETFVSHKIENTKLRVLEMRPRPPEILIGHNRYSTSGDWKDHSNNQPIHIKGVSLVFNGVISQARKEEYEKIFKKTYSTSNDGEIFARKVLDGEDWERFVAAGKFSFAGLFIHQGRLVALRNKNRPLWSATYLGAKYFASTEDIFIRAGGFKNISELPAGKAFVFEASR